MSSSTPALRQKTCLNKRCEALQPSQVRCILDLVSRLQFPTRGVELSHLDSKPSVCTPGEGEQEGNHFLRLGHDGSCNNAPCTALIQSPFSIPSARKLPHMSVSLGMDFLRRSQQETQTLPTPSAAVSAVTWVNVPQSIHLSWLEARLLVGMTTWQMVTILIRTFACICCKG